jgi:secondary thiamine-phosphate synthase enzyme
MVNEETAKARCREEMMRKHPQNNLRGFLRAVRDFAVSTQCFVKYPYPRPAWANMIFDMPLSIIHETVNTAARSQMVDITDRVAKAVQQRAVKDGFVIVFVPHTTAACTIQENADPDVQSDLLAKFEQLVPQMETYYQHDEGNSDAHVKTSMVGNSVTVLIENGRLVLGRWQGIYLVEFDGPRERRVNIKLVNLA